MAATSPGQQLNDLLVTRNFDPEALDAKTGKPPLDAQGAPDPDAANMFTFDYVADSGKNYGTVVCLIGADNNFEVYFGDNLGRGMEFDDKNNWYEFLDQLRNFAKRNLLRYDLQNLRRLKYTMAGMAAIKEGLFEGYYGNRRVSYNGEPTQARLMIKHDRTLGENDARFRHVESLFIETADGERFKLPFRKLAGGRAMLEHVRHGGTPYDARGQHIVEMVEQINVLSQFRRAHQGKVFEGAAGELIAETTEYLNQLRHRLKAVSHDRGYTQYFESWNPAAVSESDLIVEDLRGLFVETRIDPRIEQALPMLAKIQKEAQAMKEANIFESWATRIVEGTWSLPETPEQQDELKMLMSQPLPVGADGMNATEQLYGLVGDDELFDIIGDIAATDPDANIWDDERVQSRLEELGVFMVTPEEPAVDNETLPTTEGTVYDLGREYGAPAPERQPLPRGERSPARHPDDPDFMDPDQRRYRADQERVAKANAEYHAKKNQEVDEGFSDIVKNIKHKIVGDPKDGPRKTLGLHASLEKHADDRMKEIGHKLRPNKEQGVAEAGMPSSVVKSKQRYSQMTPAEFAKAHADKSDEQLVSMAWRHGYGKGSTHYVDKRNKGKQGVAEGLAPDSDLAVIGAKILNALKEKCAEIDQDYPELWKTLTSDKWIQSGAALDFVEDYITVDHHTLRTFFDAWEEVGGDPFQYWPLFWRDGQWDDFIAPWRQYVHEVLKSRGVTPKPPGQVHEQGVAEGNFNKTPSGDYVNMHTGVRSSTLPQKKKRGEKTGAEWDKLDNDPENPKNWGGDHNDQAAWNAKHGIDEGDNLATFEGSTCNMTAEGEYCPEHGLSECGNYGMYESDLARIKSLALLK